MKKMYIFLLALLMASVSSIHAWAAEREMPTVPSSSLVSGGKYYFYNVDAESFLKGTQQKYKPDTITIEQKSGENVFYLSTNSKNHYAFLESWSGTSIGTYSKYVKSEWTIAPIENGMYRIQWSSANDNFNKDHYVGFNQKEGQLYANCTEEQDTRWLFLPANEEGDRYVAEINFYNALKKVESQKEGLPLGFYEKAYANRKDYTTAEITEFANELISANYISEKYEARWYNESPIFITSPDIENFDENITNTNKGYYMRWNSQSNGFNYYLYTSNKDYKFFEKTLHAHVNLKEDSEFYYDISLNYDMNSVDIFVDGEKVNTITREDFSINTITCSQPLKAGEHRITYKINKTKQSESYYQEQGVCIANLAAIGSSEISVNLKEPGSLGTEVLYYTDHVKNVRRLKVKGAMNDDDWAKLKMMSRLQHVDLSEAVFTEIPKNQFCYTSNDTTMQFLKSAVLPEGLKTINEYAFYGSRIESLNIPSTVELVNQYAFSNCYVKELSFPADTKFEGKYNFSSMPLLEKVVLPKNLETIPENAFRYCHSLTDLAWPDSLKTISTEAFGNCVSLQNFILAGECTQDTIVLPFVETIGGGAFRECYSLKNVELHSVKKFTGGSVFYECKNLNNVSVNADISYFDNRMFQNCWKLSTLKLYSPTVVSYDNNYPPVSDLKNVTLQVPHYLVNSYKLDEYWYNAKIEGFDYSDMTYIPLRQNLTLNSERFGGKPALEVFEGVYLKINGDDAQAFADMTFNVNPYNKAYAQLLNNSSTVTQEGTLQLNYYTKAKKWYFITLPFDLDIAKTTHTTAGTQYAMRYYDGAMRAQNGATGNWKNVDRSSIIPAGTGFIFQTNTDTWSQFFAAEGSDNLAISTDEFEKTLEVNASTENSHKGWNLVGNPYQCFYNNHMLNFTAPITVWDVDKKTYAAYSITDDDYALRPNEAFFIQCPNEENNTISFPLQGRQLSSVINSQNAVKANGAAVRKLIDLTLSQNSMEDKTRVVFNDNASMAYETGCDAGKFMSMEADVPQVYTLDAQANTYAINERPFGDGIVQLGIYVAKEGAYTFSAQRNSVGNIYLVDNKEGVIINLHDQDYTFQSEAGTIEGRFSLCLNANGMATGIQDMQEDTTEGADLYDLSGRRISQTQKGVYVIRKAGKSEKVMVK